MKPLSATFAVIIAAAILAACGGGNTAATPGISLLAGTLGGPGTTDGTPGRLSGMGGIQIDALGNVYVTDSGGSTIRKISQSGQVTTVAGVAGMYGNQNGVGNETRFQEASGLAIDKGTVYVADGAGHTIRKLTPDGLVTTVAGTGVCGLTDGPVATAQLCYPRVLARDTMGSLYVDDMRVIRKITSDGIVSTFAGNPNSLQSKDGVGTEAGFIQIGGITVNSTGTVYVTDVGMIRRITSSGVVTTLAGSPWNGPAAPFYFIGSIAVDAADNLIATSGGTIYKVTPAGLVTPLTDDVCASNLSVAPNANGTIYFTDLCTFTVRYIDQTGAVRTLAGTPPGPGAVDGTGSSAKFAAPVVGTLIDSRGVPYYDAVGGIAVDEAGNVYIADAGNDLIRKITRDQVVTTVAGAVRSGTSLPGSADGIGAAARFNGPRGIAVDGTGNVYVADSGSHIIRKIDSAGIVTTFAGANGVSGSADGIAATARFSRPDGVAVDKKGNIYVADTGNCTIRKITASGIVTTFAGTAGQCIALNGTGTAARFNHPGSIAVDNTGNAYVVELHGSSCNASRCFSSIEQPNTVRKLSPDGIVTTVAGTGTSRSAWFTNVAVDSAGDVFVTDRSNQINRITPDGMVTVVAGNRVSSEVILGNLPGSLSLPIGIAVGSDGVIYTMSENSVLKIQLN